MRSAAPRRISPRRRAPHADIDFKDVDTLGEEPTKFVLRQLAWLKYQPSIIVFSGGGIHAYWLFKEPVETPDNIDRIEAALRQLADVLACVRSRTRDAASGFAQQQGAYWLE